VAAAWHINGAWHQLAFIEARSGIMAKAGVSARRGSSRNGVMAASSGGWRNRSENGWRIVA
jgi:hypothetical protein